MRLVLNLNGKMYQIILLLNSMPEWFNRIWIWESCGSYNSDNLTVFYQNYKLNCQKKIWNISVVCIPNISWNTCYLLAVQKFYEITRVCILYPSYFPLAITPQTKRHKQHIFQEDGSCVFLKCIHRYISTCVDPLGEFTQGGQSFILFLDYL